MAWIKQKLKTYTRELFIVLGTGIFSYNIFNFSSSGGFGGDYQGRGFGSVLGRYEYEYVAYYYTDWTLWLIAIGAMLMVTGVLILRNKT